MAYRPYTKAGGYGRPPGSGGLMNIFGPLTDTVKHLVIANVVVFFLQVFAGRFIIEWFSLIPSRVLPGLELWRLATYMFLHGGFGHILFNMLMLWWFGSPLEQIWGRDRFLIYYFITGVGAGIVCVPFYLLTGTPHTPILGASGALFGVLAAFALIYPNARVYLMGIMPVKAKWLVLFMVLVEFTATASYSGGSGIAHIAHLSGAVIGYFYLRRLMDIKAYWKRFGRGRKQRPFRVVRREDDDERRGPWLH